MSTPNPTHIIPDNVIVLTKRAAFESVAGTGIYHSEDFREGVSLALDALAEVLTDAGYSIIPSDGIVRGEKPSARWRQTPLSSALQAEGMNIAADAVLAALDPQETP